MNATSQIYGVRLTRREAEISQLIADGLSSKVIADRLSISYYTVANHRKNIIQKKGTRDIRKLQ